MVRETTVNASFPGVTAREYHEQTQGASSMIEWQKSNHNNDRITVGDWEPAHVHPNDPMPVQTRKVQFWQPVNVPKVLQKLTGSELIRIDDVHHLTFIRETAEVIQVLTPHITVPGIGTFTTIRMEVHYRNSVDVDGSQTLKVSCMIRASAEEGSWALRPILEAVFISECSRIVSSMLIGAAPILQSYIAKRDMGIATPVSAEWPLHGAQPTSIAVLQPDHVDLATQSSALPHLTPTHSTHAEMSASDSELSGASQRAPPKHPLATPMSDRDGSSLAEDGDLDHALESVSDYCDTEAYSGARCNEEEPMDTARGRNENDLKGVAKGGGISERSSGSQSSDADVSASSKPSTTSRVNVMTGVDPLEPTKAPKSQPRLRRVKDRWALAQQKFQEKRQRLWQRTYYVVFTVHMKYLLAKPKATAARHSKKSELEA